MVWRQQEVSISYLPLDSEGIKTKQPYGEYRAHVVFCDDETTSGGDKKQTTLLVYTDVFFEEYSLPWIRLGPYNEQVNATRIDCPAIYTQVGDDEPKVLRPGMWKGGVGEVSPIMKQAHGTLFGSLAQFMQQQGIIGADRLLRNRIDEFGIPEESFNKAYEKAHGSVGIVYKPVTIE